MNFNFLLNLWSISSNMKLIRMKCSPAARASRQDAHTAFLCSGFGIPMPAGDLNTKAQTAERPHTRSAKRKTLFIRKANT